jgi:hypothetical protein
MGHFNKYIISPPTARKLHRRLPRPHPQTASPSPSSDYLPRAAWAGRSWGL